MDGRAAFSWQPATIANDGSKLLPACCDTLADVYFLMFPPSLYMYQDTRFHCTSLAVCWLVYAQSFSSAVHSQCPGHLPHWATTQKGKTALRAAIYGADVGVSALGDRAYRGQDIVRMQSQQVISYSATRNLGRYQYDGTTIT